MPELIEYLEDGCSLEAVPHTYGCVKVRDTFTIPNTYGFDFPTDFGSTSAADTYFHAVDDGGTTYFFPPATTSPSTPTLATNVAGIQAFLTSIGSGITYTINAFNEIVLTYANPGDESIWSFWMGTSNSSDSWNNKTTPTLHDLRTDSVIYKSVQVVKLKDSEGNYIDRYFSPSTTGPLKEVNLDIFDTFSFGECHECKKEIFATHQRYYVTEGNAIPSNYVAYWVGKTLENWFGFPGANASNSYIHATYGILAGTGDGGVGTDLISPFSTPTTGMPLTDVTLVQNMTNISVTNMGLATSDYIYAITNDDQPVWFLSPAAVAQLPVSTFLHPYAGPTDVPGQYYKADVTQIAPYTIADVKQTSAQGGQSTCTPIQEIKEKDSCTGEETYRYVVENGGGQLLDASVAITNFNEANVKLECPTVVTPTIEYIPHVSGCIKRKNGTVEATCKSTDTTYNFSDTDMVGFTITANDGNGNYTIIQEQSNTIAHNKFLTLLQNVSQPNARILEDIGPGFTTLHMWTGNVTNVTSISPTEVQFDFHVEAGVTDTPTPLISPCVDPVPDATYQADAVTLRGIYDPVPLNTQQPNGGTALIFTVTNYYLEYNITGGTEDFIPAKQIVYKDSTGNLVEEYRTVGDINTLIQFNPITDSFSVNCEQTTTTASSAIYEKEVCGTIDGSVDSFELIKVYTRDATTGNITLLHYEDNFGTIVTGVVVEVCCDCNALCSVAPMPLLNRACFGYNGSFNGDAQFPEDKANIGADIFINYFEVDGNILLNSATNIGFTGTATFSDMGYGIAYDNVVNLLNSSPLFLQNDFRFVTAGNVIPDIGWGIEYNSAKSYRIIISDYIPNSGAKATWTIVVNPTEQWDGIGNGMGFWTQLDFSNNVGAAIPFNGCIAI